VKNLIKISHSKKTIPISEPVMSGNEKKYVLDCIDSNWISSQGKYLNIFEEHVKKLTGARYALAVSNGTVALQLALKTLGISKNDEVIVPNLTFAATVNSVINVGARPVIVDVDINNWTISLREVRKKITKNTKAIMPVHLYGHPVDMNSLIKICKSKGIKIIEDCAEALGAYYKGKHVGIFGDIGTFSFYGNKLITTGEGGMLIFKNKKNYNIAKILRDHGMSDKKRYYHTMIGSNYRMTNLQAAVGCGQMENFKKLYFRRKLLFERYFFNLKNITSIKFQKIEKWAQSSYWLYTILVRKKKERNKLIKYLQIEKIQTRPLFIPIHKMKIYKNYVKNFRENFLCSEIISNFGISLPSSSSLTLKKVDLICNKIKEFYK
jgi:perosamine synthetase